MTKVNLEKFSHKDLLELQRDVATAINRRRSEEMTELKRKMAEMANASGFDFNELMGGKRTSKKGSPAIVKFRNPKDPSQTWTGRGRKPTWMVEALKKGQKMETFAI
jgi:DNA-binding protein H-NS